MTDPWFERHRPLFIGPARNERHFGDPKAEAAYESGADDLVNWLTSKDGRKFVSDLFPEANGIIATRGFDDPEAMAMRIRQSKEFADMLMTGDAGMIWYLLPYHQEADDRWVWVEEDELVVPRRLARIMALALVVNVIAMIALVVFVAVRLFS